MYFPWKFIKLEEEISLNFKRLNTQLLDTNKKKFPWLFNMFIYSTIEVGLHYIHYVKGSWFRQVDSTFLLQSKNRDSVSCNIITTTTTIALLPQVAITSCKLIIIK